MMEVKDNLRISRTIGVDNDIFSSSIDFSLINVEEKNELSVIFDKMTAFLTKSGYDQKAIAETMFAIVEKIDTQDGIDIEDASIASRAAELMNEKDKLFIDFKDKVQRASTDIEKGKSQDFEDIFKAYIAVNEEEYFS